jgi:hypothetical protein
MKTTIYESDFTHNPMLEDNFTYHARVALFEHLEQLEEDLGEQWDFDPIAIRCDFTEYKNIQDFWQDYNSVEFQCMSDIEDATSVIYVDNSNSFIIQNF